MEARVLFIVSLMFISPVVAAEPVFLTGNKLQEFCSSPHNSREDIACAYYLKGFVSGIEVGDGARDDERMWCFPEGSTIGQARLVVEKYMREHPETLHRDAGVIAGIALFAAFGCKHSN